MPFCVTMDELAAAEGYFGDHLQGPVWLALESGVKSAALKTAYLEIAALIGRSEVDMNDVFQAAAVYEQAFFLAARREATPESGVRLASESVDGLGSRTFQIDPEPERREYAPRALRFLESVRACGVFSRG